jgi:hypothetical protein
MNAKIVTFSSRGDTTLLEYDPATADMEEVNRGALPNTKPGPERSRSTWRLVSASRRSRASRTKS